VSIDPLVLSQVRHDVAWHEGGHLAVGYVVGLPFGYVTIENPNEHSMGYCARWGPLPGRDGALRAAVTSLAGRHAELIGPILDAPLPASRSYRSAEIDVIELIAQPGVHGEDGDPRLFPKATQDEMQAFHVISEHWSDRVVGGYLAAADREAADLVRRLHEPIRVLSDALLDQGTLDGGQVLDICERHVDPELLAPFR
jgi:hypothetical protein